MDKEEIFDIYDENGRHVGTAPRSECHGNPKLIHRTAHVIVFDPDGSGILLQKRSRNKDIQPGRWDTAVGGHLDAGENSYAAARREMKEELGIAPSAPLELLFNSKIRNSIESENVDVYGVACSGPFDFNREEIDEVRFWTYEELRDSSKQVNFTPNLKSELEQLEHYLASKPKRHVNPLEGWSVSAVAMRAFIGAMVGFILVLLACFFVMGGISGRTESNFNAAAAIWRWGVRTVPAILALAAVFSFDILTGIMHSLGGRDDAQ